MLPVVVAAAEHQPLLGPDDLAADGEAGRLEALGDGRRVQRAMPDVGDVAGEQRPGLAPVGAVVVQHLAGAPGRGGAGLVAPGRVVVDAVGRVGDHQLRRHAVEQALDVGRHRGVAAEQPVRAEEPEIAGHRDRVLGRLGDVVLVVAGTGVVRGAAAAAARRRRSRSAAGRSPRAAGRRARGRGARSSHSAFSLARLSISR